MNLLSFSRRFLTIGLLLSIGSGINAQDNSQRPLPQFLFPAFSDGVFVLVDGTRSNATLNYNMVEEAMISEKDGVYRKSRNPADIDTIYLQNRVFVPVGKAFYEVLATGEAPFFLENKSIYTSVGEDIGYGVKSHSVANTEMTRFETWSAVVTLDLPNNVTITKASVNWVKRNGTMLRFNSVKQLLKIFPEKKHQISEFISSRKLNLKDRDDLITLGNFCNKSIF